MRSFELEPDLQQLNDKLIFQISRRITISS